MYFFIIYSAYRNVETNSTSKPLQVVQKNSINEHASDNIRKRYENSYSSKKVNQIMEGKEIILFKINV